MFQVLFFNKSKFLNEQETVPSEFFVYFLSCLESILKEKKLLVKIKLKNQLQESSMEYLIEQTLM